MTDLSTGFMFECLTRSELAQLRSIPEPTRVEWSGRRCFWYENFQPGVHQKLCSATPVIDKIAMSVLEMLTEMKVSWNQVSFEARFERTIKRHGDSSEERCEWQEDGVINGGKRYTLILMLTRNEEQWSGGDIVFNADGNSLTLTPEYNQAVLFQNDHQITPMIPKREKAVRDLFILHCYT